MALAIAGAALIILVPRGKATGAAAAVGGVTTGVAAEQAAGFVLAVLSNCLTGLYLVLLQYVNPRD